MKNTFSLIDNEGIEAVRNHLSALSSTELKAIFLRFWSSYSIQDIASELRLGWDETDRIIECALKKLRAACLSDPVFSQKAALVAA